MNQINKKKKRNLVKNSELYHYYYKKTGFYKTVTINVLKLSLIIVLIILALIILNHYLIDIESTFISFVEKVHYIFVFILFFLSDSILLSLIPPDIFILWAESFENKFLILFFLGISSYLSGILSYYIGYKISNIKKVNNWLNIKYKPIVKSVKKWGGAFIAVAAIFPIPWSPALIITGMLKYPFTTMLLFALFRFARFFIYGAVLFNVVNIF
jgi:membrane protein YqaA with SNARE-associated domain